MFFICFTTTLFAQKMEWEEIKAKTKQKVEELNRYIKTIYKRPLEAAKASTAIDLAVELFLNEDKIIEVSIVNTTIKKRFPIRKYFEHIKYRNYDKVEIDQVSIVKVSNFFMAPDGTYRGSVVIRQKFKGWVDGQIKYADETDKNIEIIVKKITIPIGGTLKDFWDVYLGDISVKMTRPLR